MILKLYRDKQGWHIPDDIPVDKFPVVDGLIYQGNSSTADIIFLELFESDLGKIILNKIKSADFTTSITSDDYIFIDVPDFTSEELMYYTLKGYELDYIIKDYDSLIQKYQ